MTDNGVKEQDNEHPWDRHARRIGLPDVKAGYALIGIALLLFTMLWVVPRFFNRAAAKDLNGVPLLTAPGVINQTYMSVNTGSGDLLRHTFKITFAGIAAAYHEPITSKWVPKVGDVVLVHYRIGRNSGLPRIDDVEPTATAPVAVMPAAAVPAAK